VPAAGRGNPHREACDPGDAHVSVRAGHGAGFVRWIFSATSSAISGTGAHVDWDLEGAAVAAAVHLLAFLGLLAWERCTTVARSSATDAAESVGGGPCEADGRDSG